MRRSAAEPFVIATFLVACALGRRRKRLEPLQRVAKAISVDSPAAIWYYGSTPRCCQGVPDIQLFCQGNGDPRRKAHDDTLVEDDPDNVTLRRVQRSTHRSRDLEPLIGSTVLRKGPARAIHEVRLVLPFSCPSEKGDDRRTSRTNSVDDDRLARWHSRHDLVSNVLGEKNLRSLSEEKPVCLALRRQEIALHHAVEGRQLGRIEPEARGWSTALRECRPYRHQGRETG